MLVRLATRRKAPTAVPCPACWSRTFRSPPVTLEHRHPAFKVLASELATLPSFRTRGRDVRILYEPSDFYATLLVSCYGWEAAGRRELTRTHVAAPDRERSAAHLHRVTVRWQGGD